MSISLGLWSTLIAYLVSIPLGIPQGHAGRIEIRHMDKRCDHRGLCDPRLSSYAILLLIVFAGGRYFQIFPLRGLTSDGVGDMTLIQQIGD